MKNKELDYDIKFMSIFIKFIAIIFRWICLINCILCAGFTIGLLVMFLVKGNDLPQSMIASMASFITNLSDTNALEIIEVHGVAKMMVATIGFGFARIVYYGLLHSLVTKFLSIFDSILEGKMFTKDNLSIIDSSVLESIILAFVMPLTIFAIYSSTKIFTLQDINMSSIIYIIIVFITKLVFTHGYELVEGNNKKNREIAEIKAQENELKIAEIKELSKPKKKVNKSVKKTTKPVKKETKKATSKK